MRNGGLLDIMNNGWFFEERVENLGFLNPVFLFVPGEKRLARVRAYLTTCDITAFWQPNVASQDERMIVAQSYQAMLRYEETAQSWCDFGLALNALGYDPGYKLFLAINPASVRAFLILNAFKVALVLSEDTALSYKLLVRIADLTHLLYSGTYSYDMYMQALRLNDSDAMLWYRAAMAPTISNFPGKQDSFAALDKRKIELLEEGLRRAPHAIEILLALGSMPGYPRAIAVLQEALQQQPTNPKVQYELASRYSEQNRHQLALALFEQLVQHDPGNVGYWRGKATSLAALGRIAEAQEAWRQVSRNVPEDDESWPHFILDDPLPPW